MQFFAIVAALVSLGSVAAVDDNVVAPRGGVIGPLQSDITIHTPDTIHQCETFNMSWTGRSGPFRVAVSQDIPLDSNAGRFQSIVTLTNATWVEYTVAYPAGSPLFLAVAVPNRAENGTYLLSVQAVGYKLFQSIGPGDSWCLPNGTAAGPSKSGHLSSGTIAGVSVGAVVAVLLTATLLPFAYRMWSRRKKVAEETDDVEPDKLSFEIDAAPDTVPTPYGPTTTGSGDRRLSIYDKAFPPRAYKSTTALHRAPSHPLSPPLSPLGTQHPWGDSDPDLDPDADVSRAELLRALSLLEEQVARPALPRGSMQAVLRRAKLLRDSQGVSPLAIQHAAEVLCQEAEAGNMPDSHFAQVLSVAFLLGAAVNGNREPVIRYRPLPEPANLTHAQDGGSVVADAGDDILPPVYDPKWQSRRAPESSGSRNV